MPWARERRKLAAIIAADVVGYSRLMGRDESGTLARLRKDRSEHLDPVLTKYGGRLVKLTGDGALVEFTAGGFIDGNAHTAVRNFKVQANTAMQIDPIAFRPHDFVLEWLAARGPRWTGWSPSPNNARFQPADLAGLNAAARQVPATDVGVLDQKHAIFAVENDRANPERHAAGH